jgi:hypothetical protein
LPDVLGPSGRIALGSGLAFRIVAIVVEGVLEFDPGPSIGRHDPFNFLTDDNTRLIASALDAHTPLCTLQCPARPGIVLRPWILEAGRWGDAPQPWKRSRPGHSDRASLVPLPAVVARVGIKLPTDLALADIQAKPRHLFIPDDAARFEVDRSVDTVVG